MPNLPGTRRSSLDFGIRVVVNVLLGFALIAFCGTGLVPVVLAVIVGGALLASSRLSLLLNVVGLLLIPVVFGFLWGSATYWLGCARKLTMGLPMRHSIGIGVVRDLRIARRTGGCLVIGGEWLVILPNNFSVYLHTKVFGYMRGTYAGSWPSVAESRTALRHAQTIPTDDLAAGSVSIGRRTFALDSDAAALVSGIRDDEFYSGCTDDGCIVGAVTTDGALVLGFSEMPGDVPVLAVPIGTVAPYEGHPLAVYRWTPEEWKDLNNMSERQPFE